VQVQDTWVEEEWPTYHPAVAAVPAAVAAYAAANPPSLEHHGAAARSLLPQWQGLRLVHFSAQTEPFLTRNTP
jgi:hypothetical protein